MLALGITTWLLAWGGAFSADPPEGTPQRPGGAAGPSAPSEAAPPGGSESQAPRPEPPVPPARAPVPERGSGELRTATFTRAAPPGQRGRTVSVRVEVERDLPLDPEAVATEVAAVLQDPRSWTSRGEARFDFAGTGPADLTVRLLTPATTDAHCRPLQTHGDLSCQRDRAVNLNGLRWAEAVPDFGGDVAGYRRYLVNHEVGHYLGYSHSKCSRAGAPAPVMMQQTKGVAQCRPNSWPLPGRLP